MKEHIPQIGMVGMSHKTAPVETRECFAFDTQVLESFVNNAKKHSIQEMVYIATCNRMELYFVSNQIEEATQEVIHLLEQFAGLTREHFEPVLYKKYHKDAVRHLLCVASSLDSMVIGENEIVGQVKEWYRWATQYETTGTILNKLFHQAFRTAKRVRTETEIARNPLSIAFIAVELAKKIFEDLSKQSVLLIGAGEMAELILKYLTKFKIGSVTLANRSLHNAQRIASEINQDATIITLAEIMESIPNVDIIISSTGAHHYMLTKDMIQEAMKKRTQPVFLIDIAVPRNIDPEAGNIHDVFLYNIDDLKSIADENLKSRLNETKLAYEMIDADTEEFLHWYESLQIVPLIAKIKESFETIRNNELKKYRRRKLKHLNNEDFAIIEELTHQIMTKTLHIPITYLKELGANANSKEAKEKAKLLQEIFKL
ncbi:MAG TPA: glutamyl-tRNA reductase [Spirochaetota bacterium]|nr:glutamyl-tRNA reductase [Spirochaetota bacterium]HOM10008.1 glutamyl-tRNA reductase [Spirochaetota bacterium]HPP50295.1 glutamyl-tRNA reductase [Spirochaetota bacterium]